MRFLRASQSGRRDLIDDYFPDSFRQDLDHRGLHMAWRHSVDGDTFERNFICQRFEIVLCIDELVDLDLN